MMASYMLDHLTPLDLPALVLVLPKLRPMPEVFRAPVVLDEVPLAE